MSRDDAQHARNQPLRVRLKPDPVWAFLEERDISQNELARRIGISSGYLMGFDQQPGVSGRLVRDPPAGEHCGYLRPPDLLGETVPRLVRPGGPQRSWGVVPESTVPLGRRRTHPAGHGKQQRGTGSEAR